MQKLERDHIRKVETFESQIEKVSNNMAALCVRVTARMSEGTVSDPTSDITVSGADMWLDELAR
jgi:hypothetical protein